MSDAIEQLAQLYGIAAFYHDWRGQRHEVALASQAAILGAIGVEVADEQAAQASIERHRSLRWTQFTPPVVIATHGHPVLVPIAVPCDAQAKTLSWELRLEDGQLRNGSIPLESLQTLEEGTAQGRTYRRLAAQLEPLPLGYHDVTFELQAGPKSAVRIIVAPEQCYQVPAIEAGRRVWGIAVQLYTLRSATNWGMGDFHDLDELIRLAAPLGCSLIGLNPLHALMPAQPTLISPYSPSNRQFLNVLYIAVEQVAEFDICAAASARVAEPAFQQRLAQLRATANVDYAGVAAAKFEILKLLYRSFRSKHLEPGTQRAQRFRQFIAEHGEALWLHALYDALDEHLRARYGHQAGWPSWPQQYREPASPAVRQFAAEHREEVEYFLYLQWLAAEQLRSAQVLALQCGMAVGLYGDLAVGAHPAGSQTWANPALYRLNASVGAPPDALALKGQDWGIPPQDPLELKQQQYQPFVGLIGNTMSYVAALRLDHVMMLYRLWWVPRGLPCKEGSYVHYPLEDLIAILALESQRNGCLTIGEDLGTVPEAVTRAMERYRAYHYKVLFFEQEASGRFKPPALYPPSSLAAVTTHDLPTLRGWWEEHDLALRDRLNLYPSPAFKEQAHVTRARDRRELLQALVEEGLWHWHADQPLPPYSAAFSRAVHAFLGLSRANIAMIQIEDLIGMADPVNVPGTHVEHANWQRKLSGSSAEIFARAQVRDILGALDLARRGINPNA